MAETIKVGKNLHSFDDTNEELLFNSEELDVEVIKTLKDMAYHFDGKTVEELWYFSSQLCELLLSALYSSSKEMGMPDDFFEELLDGIKSSAMHNGGFYKFISDDFAICFEQIAVRNEEAMRAL